MRFSPLFLFVAIITACNSDGPPIAPAAARYEVSRIDTLLLTSATHESELRPAIGGTLRVPDGRVYLIDWSSSALVRLTPGDTALARTGRKGGGPGDLQGPCCLRLMRDASTILVYERENSRYSMFDTSLTFLRTIPAPLSRNGMGATGITAEGWLVHPRIEGALGGTLFNNEIVYYDTDGTEMRRDTIVLPKEMVPATASFEHERTVMTTGQPFGPHLSDAVSASGEYAVLNSGTGRIRILGADRTWTEFHAVIEPGPMVSAEERKQALENIRSNLEGYGKTMADLPFDIPDRKAPFQDLFFDPEGRLWVQRTTDVPDAQVADVYAANTGQAIGRFAWPAGVQLSPAAIDGLEAIGSATDDEGYVRIVRITFVKR